MQWPTGAQTNYSYASTTETIVQQYQNSPGDGALETRTLYDGLGRARETDSYESSSQYIATTTSYDELGRVATTTNPSRPGDGLNYATTYAYDALGRSKQVQTADGGIAQTNYTGNQVTAIDQAGHQKQYGYDALGRLNSVEEDPSGVNYQTTYNYDTLGNLTSVNQAGGSAPLFTIL